MTNVVILAHNRPALTKQTFDSLGDMSDARIYVCGHKCTPEMQDVIVKSGPGDKMIGFTWQDIGTGPLRNYVIQQASVFGRGEFLYTGDNDCFFLQRDWLAVMTMAYSEAWSLGFRILGAYGHPYHLPIDKIRLPQSRWSVHEVTALASQSWFMHWSVWDSFGPLCDTPPGKVCQSEDVEFSNKIRAAGYKVGVISPPLLVNTGITNSFGEHIPGWELVKSQCPPGVLCE